MDSLRFNEEDFNEYLEQLIKSGRLNLMQAGITKLVIDKGYDVLSFRQRKVFDYMIDTNTIESCKHCACDIPWCKMLDALDNGGYCDYCEHMMKKLENE